MTSNRVVGLGIGYLLDRLVGDPSRGHPVAAFGAAVAATERRVWADRRGRGVAFAAGCLLPVAAVGVFVDRCSRGRPVLSSAAMAASTWVVLGGRSLVLEIQVMAHLVERASAGAGVGHDGLSAARARLSHLCSRDPHELDESGLVRACLESLAENTSDAVVGPLFWGAVAGPVGLLVYRAINTLDAMVGYRTSRYERFGWAAARLDDVANLLPARLTALLTVAAAPVVGGHPGSAWRLWRRDAGRHPSPNAGPVEAASAGALGVSLGGVHRQADGSAPATRSVRGPFGDGPPPTRRDLGRGVQLHRVVSSGSLLVCLTLARCVETRSRTADQRRSVRNSRPPPAHR